MIQRCRDPICNGYERYGGRGIMVCPRWASSFADFVADMGYRPSTGHSIDRIDVNGHYEPGNCRWATRSEQSRNRRNTRIVEAFGITSPLVDFVRMAWVPADTIYGRLTRGWSIERALSTPRNPPLLALRGNGNAMNRPDVRARVGASLKRRHAARDITIPWATLTDDAVRHIFALRGKVRARDVATQFSTKTTLVHHIWSGRTFRAVTGMTQRINRRASHAHQEK